MSGTEFDGRKPPVAEGGNGETVPQTELETATVLDIFRELLRGRSRTLRESQASFRSRPLNTRSSASATHFRYEQSAYLTREDLERERLAIIDHAVILNELSSTLETLPLDFSPTDLTDISYSCLCHLYDALLSDNSDLESSPIIHAIGMTIKRAIEIRRSGFSWILH